MLENSSWWPIAWFAILRIGAVIVPVNCRSRSADLRHVLSDSGAVAVITNHEFDGLVRATAEELSTVRTVIDAEEADSAPGDERPPVAIDSATVTNLQYTSGTTGFPKACILTHAYWLRTAWLIAQESGMRSDDVVLMSQPFSYMDQQWAMLMALMARVPFVMLPRFSASGFWASAREHGATVSYVLGSMPRLLLKQEPTALDRENRMRLVLCSGIDTALHARLEERWGAPWRELYGSTETGPDLIVRPGDVASVGSGSMGMPPRGKTVTVVDELGEPCAVGEVGEIVVSGTPMMNGYWNHPDATAAVLRDGTFHTGDLGFVDEHGGIHHAGRSKDVIRRGGENVSAAEVESVIAVVPGVLTVAVVGVPDELFGEVPKAFVQLAPGRRDVDVMARELLEHAEANLARFKVPARWEFVDSFEMTPSERVQKRTLVEPGRDQVRGSFDSATRTWNHLDDTEHLEVPVDHDGCLAVSVVQGVAVIRLDRPDKLNALTGATRRELAATLRHLGTGALVRGIVLTGTGRAFCAGEDLDEAGALAPGGLVDEVLLFNDITRAAIETRVPLVAAINGIAVGGACELTLCFDSRIGSPDAAYFLPENGIGLSISNAASLYLPRLLGSRAIRAVLGTTRWSAEEALVAGLLDEIVPTERLVAHAIELVRGWTEPGSATAVHLELLRPSIDDVERAMAAETEAARRVDASGLSRAGIGRFLASR
jgi:acyl-CoA synthetase (AMP-forming)/AMP-acid ligase II/enoyl-CoA hydratase/carnithine racemase